MIWKVLCTQKGEASPHIACQYRERRNTPSIHLYAASLSENVLMFIQSTWNKTRTYLLAIMLREGRDSFTCCQSSHAIVASKTFTPDNHRPETHVISTTARNTTSIFPTAGKRSVRHPPDAAGHVQYYSKKQHISLLFLCGLFLIDIISSAQSKSRSYTSLGRI